MSTEVIVTIAAVIVVAVVVITVLVTKWYCRREYRYELEDRLYDVNHRHKVEMDKVLFENELLKDTLEYRTTKLDESIKKAIQRNNTLSAELEMMRRQLKTIEQNHPEINFEKELYKIRHPHL